MIWRKLGLVFTPDGSQAWAKTHAFVPTVHPRLVGGNLRILYASLDEHNYGRIGWVDVDAANPTTVVGRCREPLLDLGEPGTFEDCGVNASCFVEKDGLLYLYTIGWQRTERVPYLVMTGLAVSEDGGNSFRRLSRVPIMERTHEEPFQRANPCILWDGGRYRMWYTSAHAWETIRGRVYPNYVVRYAESDDGVHWTSAPRPAIDYQSPDEFGFARPWVVKDPDRYRMWYSIRSRERPYRIGYAESADGTSWARRDAEVGIEASAPGEGSGWDAEMICYPCIADVGGRRLMFYNGNGHGRSGFGVAVLEE